MPPRIVVIGAGISGLTCAYRLVEKGLDVLLLELQDWPGGVIRTDGKDGFLFEQGPNSFRSTPEFIRLIEELQLSDELVTASPSAPRYIYFAGTLMQVPMNPVAFLGTRLIGPRDKLGILLEPFAPKPPGREETVAEFFERRFGRQVLDRLVQPFVSGVYAGDASRLSLQASFPMLAELERQYGSVLGGLLKSLRKARKPAFKPQLCSFRRGLSSLPERLAERLGQRTMLSREVTGLHYSLTSVSAPLTIEVTHAGQVESIEADAVVIATPAHVSARLLRPLSKELADRLESIEHPPLVVVCLGYEGPSVPRAMDGFGFLVARNEGLRILGCIWNSSLFPGRAPEGGACLTSFLGGATDPAAAELTDDAVIEVVRRDLASSMGIRSNPRAVAVYRYSRSIPQYHLGHPALRRQVAVDLLALPHLFLAGNYLGGVSTGDCVEEATKIADQVAADLSSPSPPPDATARRGDP
ncbi:MAG: protoporphyrinogen oxidase [Acidobacteria bacterium]|nr:protoporphyrinogen oxidase [Acidobacteriota bacterium]